MSTQVKFLDEIEQFLRERGIAETTFGRRAVNDGKFVGRVRAGHNLTLMTMDRVRKFMSDEREKMTRSPAPAEAA
jgi:hypothetical protein